MTLDELHKRLSAIPPSAIDRGSREAHVWVIDGALSPREAVEARSWLSAEEDERAERFRYLKDRHPFMATRAALRLILAHYAASDPRTIQFSSNAFGKPCLTGLANPRGIEFNVSHSGEHGAILVTAGTPAGIDLEKFRLNFSTDDIAARFFTAREHQWLRAQPAAEQRSLFFRLWALKEAVIKADGRGLSMPLEETEMAVAETPARLLSGKWWICGLDLLEGYAAALALRSPPARLLIFQGTKPGQEPPAAVSDAC